MAVLTPLSTEHIEGFIAAYNVGSVRHWQGISAGSENSNFFVTTDQGEFVLTLIERGDPKALPFFVTLLKRLHQANLPVPYAIEGIDGVALRTLAGKPALLQPRLSGSHIHTPNAHHCQEVGKMLAKIHVATCDHMIEGRSDRGLQWMLEVGPALLSELEEDEQALLKNALAEIETLKTAIWALPQANLHADLFLDNVLFEGAHLSGVIDFYNACQGPMLYDVAITCNDWCSNTDGSLDRHRAEALLGAYVAHRPCTVAEAELWPALLRIACVRFWLSRLVAKREALAGMPLKAPEEFAVKLRQRLVSDIALPMAF